ncbi:MAG: hypothetical protein IV088_11830 [Hydrogenophaga sp.]|uniref:hypothetical protein n=1 Tax=Hydrogenophaga sp. TaxID=1904254 RepID=UPI0025BCAA50|nr:hypothetical protein [Hydrogenophaga sp.]MBT9551533.1 hypothetical protein [Hydrogenophaga sp.]
MHHNALSPASVERLNQLSEQMGMKVLHAVNKAAMEAEQQDHAAATQAGLPAGWADGLGLSVRGEWAGGRGRGRGRGGKD